MNGLAGYLAPRVLSAGDTHAVRARLLGFDAFNAIIGLEEKYALDERFRS